MSFSSSISKIVGWFGAIQRTAFDWQFPVKSETACIGLRNNCIWPRGKMLGGSSGLNLMLYVRGCDRDFDEWAARGNKGWCFDDVLPFFKKSEANKNPSLVKYKNGMYHSDDGCMNVSAFGEISPFANVFYEAGMERGHPFIDDINADKHCGFVNLQGTVFDGRRQSTAKAFLIPSMNRINFDIIKNAFVTKILINDRNRAYGVQFDLNGKSYEAYANIEVILSAGAVMSPVILMQSGIGPKRHLFENKIPCKIDLAGVGNNLYDHIYSMLFFEFDPTPTPSTIQLDNIYNLAVHNTGPLTSAGISQLALFANTEQCTANKFCYPNIEILYFWFTQNAPNLQAYVNLRQFKSEIANTLLEKTKTRNIGALLISVLLPKSSGQIRLNGTSPYNKPIIDPKYFSHRDDMNTMIDALKDQASYVNTKSYRNNGGKLIRFPLEECDKFKYMSDKYLECYVKIFAATEYHPVGTCKMGPKTDGAAVVNSELKVHKVDRLRVIDASM